MRLCLLSALLLFSMIVSGQSKVGRSGDPVTVEDWRLFAKYNFRPPVFRDTADANLHLGLDSCGAMIFTRSDNKLWKRLCSPKKWEEIGSGSGVESDPVWTADKPSYRTKLQNDALYYPLTGNPSGFLTSFIETDPVYSASSWFSTTNNSSNWNTAFGWGNHASAGYLTSFSETDPVWGAEKSGYLTAAAAALAYSPIGHSHTFASLTSKPTTISGYGITDAFTQAIADLLYSPISHTHTFTSLTSKPTTISGYGITIVAGDVPTLNQNTTGTAAGLSATLVSGSGGTGFSTYTTGDIIYASATNTLSKKSIGSAGDYLTISGGVPVWQSLSANAYNVGGFNSIFTGNHRGATLTIGTGTNAPSGGSIAEFASTTKGVLLPRMTKTQRDAISSPAAGLMIYQTDSTPGLRVYNGTNWMRYTETAD